MVFLGPVLDPILSPLLALPPVVGIFIISFVITGAITLVYKYATDQQRMRQLKEEMKKHQKEIKKHQKDPQKMMEIQKVLMQKNMEYMKHSFRPTIFTILPIILIFGWLNAHMAYYPIEPGQPFTVTAFFAEGSQGNVTLDVRADSADKRLEFAGEPTKRLLPHEDGHRVSWQLQGPEGQYRLQVIFGSGSFRNVHNASLIITDERLYEPPEVPIKDGPLEQIRISNEKVAPLGISLFGWRPGWLATYILFSIIISISLRKLLGVN